MAENFRLVGKHLTNAGSAYGDTETSLTNLDAKLGQIEQPQLSQQSDRPQLT